MIRLKTKEEIARINKAGDIASEALEVLSRHLKPGTTTYELDKLARDYIVQRGAVPAFKGYRGFPANICTSSSNIIVHGIPSKNTVLKNNSIISIDIGIKLDGYYADSAYTFIVGEVSESARRLVQVTKEALYKGIEKLRVGSRLGDLSSAIQTFVESNGFGVVRDFVGHGVGYEIHEDPEVPNFGTADTGVRLEEGMVLAIEPMVNEGSYRTKVLDDGWTVVTEDGTLSAHFEHTVAIGKNGPEVLTEWPKKMR